MTNVEQSIEVIARVVQRKHGMSALSKMSGVAISTIMSAKKCDFRSRTVTNLIELEKAAREIEAAASDEAA